VSAYPKRRARLSRAWQNESSFTILLVVDQRIGLVDLTAFETASAREAIALVTQRWKSDSGGCGRIPNVLLSFDLDCDLFVIRKYQNNRKHLALSTHGLRAALSDLARQTGLPELIYGL
jgi:hypothetical protein